MLRRILLSACLLLPVVGYASAENPVAGQDYTVLKTPVQTQEPKKIEVLTFFAYTCPHCYTYEKDVLPWSEKLPDDVVFRQIPVAWTPKSFHFTKTYYALEAMHKLHPYHEMLFNAVIKEKKRIPRPQQHRGFLCTERPEQRRVPQERQLFLDQSQK